MSVLLSDISIQTNVLCRIVRSVYCVSAYKLPTILINIILIKIIDIDISELSNYNKSMP